MNTTQNISIAILCGGKSSRMGKEKGLVIFQNKPFIEHIIEAVKSISNEIFIVTNNASYEKFGFPLVTDVYPDKGPVGGIFSALKHANNDKVLILSCDIPLIQTTAIQKLIDSNTTNTEAIYLTQLHQKHPLIGIYDKKIKRIFENAIISNELKLMDVLLKINTKEILIDNNQSYQLQNINTPEALHNLDFFNMSLAKKVTLIGAGPGDPELITLKAIKALQQAQVVLYDALVNETLLDYAPQAKKIFVGKRIGCHAFTQPEINQLIVEQAYEFDNIVRLKGGDPFVFGRGSEEIEYVEKHGISTVVIPGISSAVAVPASKGISITKRGVAESFWVITGTTSNHQLSNDVALAAQSTATVVILMGMHKLNEIVCLFKVQEKHDLPIAIIQNGTTSNEKMVIGTIQTIESKATIEKISSPAIIIIGEVVKHSSQLKHFFKEQHTLLSTVI